MKKLFFSLLALCFSFQLSANGVCIVNAEQGTYLTLFHSSVSVQIQNQVAITTSTQHFRNDLGLDVNFKYGFPMTSGGTAVGLRWQLGGVWHEAEFSANPQDTILPGGGGGGNVNPHLKSYLGNFPLYFQVLQALPKDSTVVIELTYVELLPYKLGVVSYFYPNNYKPIQTTPLVEQSFQLTLYSGRKIESLSMPSHPSATVAATDYQGTASYTLSEQPAEEDYGVEYVLNANDLGLFSFSNFLSDTLGCDTFGNGFCAFVVEPNPNPDADVIPKVFTLIIDRSGSMSGQKMIQARNAAKFIVENLNTGDLFNVIDFDDQITSFKPDHVPYTTTHRDQALAFINALNASGSTNISGAFGTAIPQFANDIGNTYNIIIFFTDGQATAGITSTAGILNYVSGLITAQEVNVSIFTFGIGADVNKPLLTQLANNNKGIARFLDNNELEATITEFYLTIRNPVLLNISMQFDPNLVYETYPIPLPNLFKGSQMLVVGRYNTPGTVNVTFNGQAFGSPVIYDYTMPLSGTDSVLMRFLPKLWAKQKAEHLLQQYYATNNTAVAEALKAQIQHLSICYGVITDLTSFEDPGSTSIFETPSRRDPTNTLQLTAISPNPARQSARIEFTLHEDFYGTVQVEVYDIFGRLVASFSVPVNGSGTYDTVWNIGTDIQKGTYWIKLQSEKGGDVGKVIVH